LTDVIIENPILNSAYEVPTRYFKFTDKGITNEPVEGRRRSGYFIPIPPPKKKGKQLSFETEWTQDRFEESKFINDVRERVNLWRRNRFPSSPSASRAAVSCSARSCRGAMGIAMSFGAYRPAVSSSFALPCAHTSTDVSPRVTPFRQLFERAQAAAASDGKMGWAVASYSACDG